MTNPAGSSRISGPDPALRPIATLPVLGTTNPVTGVRRVLRVDLAALVRNAHVLASSTRVSARRPDLRSNAFGLGAERVSAALEGLGFAEPEDDAATPVAEELYGLAPSAEPVVRLVGEIVSLKRVPAGQAVSYGYTYRTRSPATLALVGLGYADGVVRRASNVAPVAVGGRRRTVTGRVAMDQFVIDLHDDVATVGDEVVLFGDPARGDPAISEWSDATGWPALSLLAGLGPRIERVYE